MCATIILPVNALSILLEMMLQATTPLTLSLLIQLFKSQQLQQSTITSDRMNRGGLYEAGVLHMLKFKQQQTEEAQPDRYKRIGRELNGEVWSFLEVLALDLHRAGCRDFNAEDVDRLGFSELWGRLEPHIVSYSVPVLMRLEVDPTAAITRSSNRNARSDSRFTFRFIHLTFQEVRSNQLLTVLIQFN